MIPKIIIGLLLVILLGLSAFIALDRWPDGNNTSISAPIHTPCPPGYITQSQGTCLYICSKAERETLAKACYGAKSSEACMKLATCDH